MRETLIDRIANRLARRMPRRLVNVVPSRPIVSFTFDDVPDSARANGAPILESHGARATFYVAGGVAGQTDGDLHMLDRDGYRDLAARGHEIAHHTFSHRKATELGRHYSEDLDSNDAYLAAVIDGKARNFAFPYGLSSPRAQRLLSQRFRSSRGVRPGINRGPTNLDYLLSVEIREYTPVAKLKSWIDEAVVSPGWLTFFTHDVSRMPSLYGCHPDVLETLVAYAVERGCEVLTVDAALDRLGIAS